MWPRIAGATCRSRSFSCLVLGVLGYSFLYCTSTWIGLPPPIGMKS